MQRLYVSLGPPKNVNRTVLGRIGEIGEDGGDGEDGGAGEGAELRIRN